MEIRWYQGAEPRISDIKVTISDGEVLLNFKWPNELEHICIYKQGLLSEETIDWEKPYRKYTRSEYASFGGFRDQNIGDAICRYILCPYIEENGQAYLINYKEQCNEIKVVQHKIKISYEIQEKKRFFSSRKLIQMQVFCESPLPKQYLCYVKKKGSIPVGLEDGMQFQFISDFVAGENKLPEIEVDKEEYVRIYLTDEVPYKEAYQIMKG